jgi:uncharacterized protein
MRESQPSLRPFILYLVVFQAFWMSVYVFGIYPWMLKLDDTTLRFALVNLAVRLCVWVAPVFLYLRYVDHVNPVEYLKLKEHWPRGVLIGLAFGALIFAGSLVRLRFGPPHPTVHPITWNSILVTSVLIGFVEEIPYRGFILQKFEERIGFSKAALITSALFLSMHLPGWISLQKLSAYNVVYVFVFGFVMALLLRYGKSLWGPIVAHSLNDAISTLIFHL